MGMIVLTAGLGNILQFQSNFHKPSLHTVKLIVNALMMGSTCTEYIAPNDLGTSEKAGLGTCHKYIKYID